MQVRNDELRSALGIGEDYVPGSAFNPARRLEARQRALDAAAAAALAKRKYTYDFMPSFFLLLFSQLLVPVFRWDLRKLLMPNAQASDCSIIHLISIFLTELFPTMMKKMKGHS